MTREPNLYLPLSAPDERELSWLAQHAERFVQHGARRRRQRHTLIYLVVGVVIVAAGVVLGLL